MIKRELYLKKIRNFYNEDLIKVLTGMRRCGKSTILNQIIDEIKDAGVSDDQIIYINFENKDFSFIKNDDDLYNYIKSLVTGESKKYLFFDEIGYVENWERAINSFKSSLLVSIFITGSNSDLLSSDLSTLLAGRYISFKIMPFTFAEVKEYLKIDSQSEVDDLFSNYLIYGGLPQQLNFDNDQMKKMYLSDVFDSILVRDIISRFNIKELSLFNKVLEYIITTPSQFFSADSLTNYFLSDNIDVSKNTIYNYLDFMVSANILNKACKYDIRGKRLLTTKYKYYLTDLGFSSILSSQKKLQLGAFLENVVHNELLANGYEVSVGNYDKREIDFIATKFGEKLYIQVAYILADDNVIEREFGNYKLVDDNFPKLVISMDKFDFSRDGVVHKNIIDWLLEDK